MGKRHLKILILCYYFPPYNVAGSLRLGMIAKHFKDFGHEVRVICANNTSTDKSLKNISGPDIHYVDCYQINDFAKKIAGGRKVAEAITQTDKNYLSFKGKTLYYLSRLYRNVTNIPDGQRGFISSATKKADEILNMWNADIIYASALPASVLVAANKISRKHQIPFVAEFRDLWTTNHYYSFPPWRRLIDSIIENKVLKSAKAFVTVSEPLEEDLKKRFPGTPSKVILNGADMETLNSIRSEKKNNAENNPNSFNIVYTGSLYKGKRDPSILFEAINRIKVNKEDCNIKVHFYGKDSKLYIEELANKFKISENVVCHGNVSYTEALKAQISADMLLLLLWIDESETGVFTGKLFEYVAARRPILCVGHRNNVAVKLINERNLGFATDNSSSLRKLLVKYMDPSNELLSNLPMDSIEGLTRYDQSLELSKFLLDITNE